MPTSESDRLAAAQGERVTSAFFGIALLCFGAGVWYFANWGGVAIYIGAIFFFAGYRLHLTKPRGDR